MDQDEALRTLNTIIDEWNAGQPFLLLTEKDCRHIYVRPYTSDGWQRFIATDTEFQSNEGPHGFGKTKKEALSDLVSNPEYQRLIGRLVVRLAPLPEPER